MKNPFTRSLLIICTVLVASLTPIASAQIQEDHIDFLVDDSFGTLVRDPFIKSDYIHLEFSAATITLDELYLPCAVAPVFLRGSQGFDINGPWRVTIGNCANPDSVATLLASRPCIQYAETVSTEAAPLGEITKADFPTDPSLCSQMEYAHQDVDGEDWSAHPNNCSAEPSRAEDFDMDLPQAWGITRGDPNVLIAVIDTGVNYDHPDLGSQMFQNPGEVPGDGSGEGLPGVPGVDDDNDGRTDEDLWGRDHENPPEPDVVITNVVSATDTTVTVNNSWPAGDYSGWNLYIQPYGDLGGLAVTIESISDDTITVDPDGIIFQAFIVSTYGGLDGFFTLGDIVKIGDGEDNDVDDPQKPQTWDTETDDEGWLGAPGQRSLTTKMRH